jgi:hypothetical protein
MWTLPCIQPGFPTSYPQSVDGYAKPATRWQRHYPQVIHSFLHRAIGRTSLRDPALPAGSRKVWHLGGAADQQVELVESFV